MKEVVAQVIKKALKEKGIKLEAGKIMELIEIPQFTDFGDYAFPCFFLEEELKEEPDQIALELREKIKKFPVTDFEDIQTRGAYVNFFVNRGDLARKIAWEAITQKRNYG